MPHGFGLAFMTIDMNINQPILGHVIATAANTALKYSGTWLNG